MAQLRYKYLDLTFRVKYRGYIGALTGIPVCETRYLSIGIGYIGKCVGASLGRECDVRGGGAPHGAAGGGH